MRCSERLSGPHYIDKSVSLYFLGEYSLYFILSRQGKVV